MINISLVKFELLFSLLSACLDSDTRVFGPLLACCSFTLMGGWWRTRRLKWWRKEKNQWAVKAKSFQEEQTLIHQHLVATLHIKKTLNPKTPRLYPPSTQSPVTTPPSTWSSCYFCETGGGVCLRLSHLHIHPGPCPFKEPSNFPLPDLPATEGREVHPRKSVKAQVVAMLVAPRTNCATSQLHEPPNHRTPDGGAGDECGEGFVWL